MKTMLLFITEQEQQFRYYDCIQFMLVRDRYQPYATLHARMQVEQPALSSDDPVAEVQFYLNNVLLFEGIAKKTEYVHEQNHWVLKITAQSFSSALVKNQLVPGIHTGVTLQSLMETYKLPKVTYETGIEETNYIYVKANTAMWDSIIAYNYKLCNGFPYVRLPNMLCMLPRTGKVPIQIPADRILRYTEGSECSEMISRIDMANAEGNYGKFSLTNFEALRRGIVRIRQSLLDKQYLYDPSDALRFRVDISNRKLFSKSVSYTGHCFEDLEDLVRAGTQLTARVSRIVISGDAKGIVTTDTFYFDSFCNTKTP